MDWEKHAGSRISYYPHDTTRWSRHAKQFSFRQLALASCNPLKIPVILKPGKDEPWTAYRLIQALIASGCPADAFGFYRRIMKARRKFFVPADAL
jgi:hypothetical protein